MSYGSRTRKRRLCYIRALAFAAACALASGALAQPLTDAGVLHAAGQAAAPPAFLLVVPLQPLRPDARGYPVQILRFSAAGTSQQLYRSFTVRADARADTSIAITPDARWLAYSDATAVVHLVALAQGRDRRLGRGAC